MEPTREEQIAQINDHLGLPPEGELSDVALARLRSPEFLGLWGKPIPELDDEEAPASNAKEEAQATNSLRTYPERWVRSPNYSGPSRFNPKGVIFHFTGYSLQSALNWLVQEKSQSSYHVIIDRNGDRFRLVDDRHRAWHAGGRNGSSKIQGVNPNGVCLGVAFTGNLYTGEGREGVTKLEEDEIESAMEFLRLRWRKFGLQMSYVSDHRTVDPTRRNDIPPEHLDKLVERMRKEGMA